MRLLNDDNFMNSAGQMNQSGDPLSQIDQEMNLPPSLGMERPPEAPPDEQVPEENTFTNKYINDKFTGSNIAQDAYQKHLQSIPNRANFHPSRMRKIAAVMAGLGGVGPSGYENGQPLGIRVNPEVAGRLTKDVLDEPFNEATEDWQRREKPLEFAYNEEFKNNNLQRQLLGQRAREDYQKKVNEARNRDIDRKIEKDKADNEYHKAESLRKTAGTNSLIWMRNHPDWKTVPSKGGHYWMINPKTGDKKDTGIPTGTMDEHEKLLFNYDQKANLEDIQALHAQELETKKAEDARKLKETPGADKGGAGGFTETTTTTIDPKGQSKNVVKTRVPSAKVSTGGNKVRMINPDDGKEYEVDDKDVAEAKTHKWKIKGEK